MLLLAVVVSGVLSRLLPSALPRPLVQIAFGALLGFSGNLHVELAPALFFLLFVPPLLFADGWSLPNDGLVRERGVILGLALGLVFLTVLGMGLLIHWLIPELPLPVAFALAAVVSPTDPVAVSAITAGSVLPKRMMHILEGEALLNDASALVCLRFAIAAAISGTFSLLDTALGFVILTLGGLAIGIAIAILVTWLTRTITIRFGEESGLNILITLLVPFAAYISAERIGGSGVLAAATAGIAMSHLESSSTVLAHTRVRRKMVWDMVRFTLNGVIFVLLGEQLPRTFEGARAATAEAGHESIAWLALYVFSIVAGLALLRFVWVWLSLRLTVLKRPKPRQRDESPLRLVAAISCAGVRGAVTLAGVLSIPLALPGGAPFPGRELAVFLATGVILVSLVIASVSLPLLSKHLHMPRESRERSAREERARIAAAHAAIDAIDALARELPDEFDDAHIDAALSTTTRITGLYRARIVDLTREGNEVASLRSLRPLARRVRSAAIAAERETLHRLADEGEIDRETEEWLIHELDLRVLRMG